MRSVTFNGVTRFTPGGITRIHAEALNQVGISSTGSVALIGEADGGAPGSESGLVILRDDSRATQMFRSGPLADAIRLAFHSSGDDVIVGGASEVVIYKVNKSTQSKVHVPDMSSVLVSAKTDVGSTTTSIKLAASTMVAGEHKGRWVSVALNSLPVLANYTAAAGSTVSKIAVSGLIEGQFVGKILQFESATPSAPLKDVYASIIHNDGDFLYVAGALPAAPTTSDKFDILASYRCKVVDNSSNTLTISPPVPVAPASGDGVFIYPTLMELVSKDYGAYTAGITADVVYEAGAKAYRISVVNGSDAQISGPVGGKSFIQLYYKGGANAEPTDTILTPAGATETSFDLTTGGLTVGAYDGATVVVTNPDTGRSEQVRIEATSAGSLLLAAPGLSSDFVREIRDAAASTVLVDIKTVENAVAFVEGSKGMATALKTTITGVTGDDLNLTISQHETVRQLVDRINSNVNYVAVVPANVNGDTTLASSLDFGPLTSVNIQREVGRNDGAGLNCDLKALVDWFVNNCESVNASRFVSAGKDGAALPKTDALTDAAFGEGLALSGGSRGTSSNSDWQAGFDALLRYKTDAVCPLIDQDLIEEGFGSTATWASVSQQLLDHVSVARGAVGKERGGYIGFRGTKSQYIAALNSLNDMDIQCVSQYPTVLNAAGTLEKKGPREFAVMAASMRAGVPELGEPLTHKYLSLTELTQDPSWNPLDVTDSADLISAGALFAETISGKGTRWVRDITTWVKNDNLCYMEGCVRSVIRALAYDIRSLLEDRFTGRKAQPATIPNVKDALVPLLDSYRENNAIVDSKDPTTGKTIKAWHGLKIYSEGDVLRVAVGVFPVVGINFQLSDIFLQLPSQSA